MHPSCNVRTLERHGFFFSSKMYIWTLWDDDHSWREGAERPKAIIKLLNHSCLSTSLAISHRCNFIHAVIQNKLPVGKKLSQIYNIHHKQESTDSSFDKGQTDICLRWSWPTAHRSIFQSSSLHAGQHKNVDNTLLINRKSALEKQGEAHGLWNESWSLKPKTHQSMCEDQAFSVTWQTAI